MDDLEQAGFTRRHHELMKRARTVVEEARRNRNTSRQFSAEARERATDLAKRAKAAAAQAQEERIRAEDIWNRVIEAVTPSQAPPACSGGR